MREVSLGVAVVALGLFLIGLGHGPFADPPEGFHAVAAARMLAQRDWITPRVDGVRVFDEPPLLYWLVAAGFRALGATPLAARLGPALAAVALAAVTARLGVMLGGARVGLLAGLMLAANLGVFLNGRIAKPDLLFVLWLTLAFWGFAVAYRGRRRPGLVVFYAAIGLAALTKDLLGALAPVVIVALFFWMTRERPLAPWVPWWGVLLAAGIGLPWYLAVEAGSRGFLWYSLVDSHALVLFRHRLFPDAEVPLSSAEFLVVTLVGFLPWALALPWGLGRAFRRPWEDATGRLWLLVGLWAVFVVGFFTLAPFKLPHDGLVAFPALALLTARAWDETIEGVAGSARPRALVTPLLVLFLAGAAALLAMLAGLLPIPGAALAGPDVAPRTQAMPLVLRGAVVCGVAAAVLAVAARRRAPALGVGVALAATIAFLSSVAGEGMTQLLVSRSVRPVALALAAHARSGDLIVHEGPIENSASVLLGLPGPVPIVGGDHSILAFGATFPEGADVLWDAARLRAAWAAPGRLFLLSTVPPERSAIRGLPPGSVHLMARAGGRSLYANVADRAAPGR